MAPPLAVAPPTPLPVLPPLPVTPPEPLAPPAFVPPVAVVPPAPVLPPEPTVPPRPELPALPPAAPPVPGPPPLPPVPPAPPEPTDPPAPVDPPAPPVPPVPPPTVYISADSCGTFTEMPVVIPVASLRFQRSRTGGVPVTPSCENVTETVASCVPRLNRATALRPPDRSFAQTSVLPAVVICFAARAQGVLIDRQHLLVGEERERPGVVAQLGGLAAEHERRRHDGPQRHDHHLLVLAERARRGCRWCRAAACPHPASAPA